MGLDAAVPGVAIAGCVISGIIAAIHIYIFVLESILWRTRAAKVFKFPQSVVDTTIVLAANQGFYNLLLAAGLIWGLAELDGRILLFFLAAVATAGIFGVITSSPRILFVQVIPGVIGFIFVDFGFFPTEFWSKFRHPVYQLIIFLGVCVITAVSTFIIKKMFIDKGSGPSSRSAATVSNDI